MGDTANVKKRKGCLNPFKRGCFLYVYLPLFIGVLIVGTIWWFESRTTAEKLARVTADLERLTDSVTRFHAANGHYPDTLDELLTPDKFIGELPIDPFSPDGNTYRYMNLNDGYLVVVYSVGKDGEDNYCQYDESRVVHNDGRGDLDGLAVCLQIERTKDDPDNGMSLFMKACLKTKADLSAQSYQDLRMVADLGWERALVLISYLSVDSATPGSPDLKEYVAEYRNTRVIPNLDSVMRLIQDNQEALDLVYEGSGKPYTRSVYLEEDFAGLSRRIPNYLPAQAHLAKMLESLASHFEAEQEYETALMLYLNSIRLGQAMGHTDLLIGRLIGLSIEQEAYGKIVKLLSRRELSSDTLEALIVKMMALEADAPSIKDAFDQEADITYVYAKKMTLMKSIQYANYFVKDNPLGNPPATWRDIIKVYFRSAFLSRYYIRESAQNNRRQAIAAAMPYRQRVQEKYLYHDMFEDKPVLSSCSNAAAREVSLWSTAAATKIIIALQLYKLNYNAYPDSLDALSEFLNPVPVDPFTEEAFMYAKSGRGYVLYSIGPELEDNGGAIAYDPTNGSVSSGDLLFH